MPNNTQQKCAYIALIGAPNAGKSTLVNHLVKSKVSIVTPKVQTTRISIKGIFVKNNCQLIFIDTPGIFIPKKTLEKAIVNEAWSRIEEADFLALLVDVKKGICKDTLRIINALKHRNKRAILILNKIDTIPRENLLSLSQDINQHDIFDETFMISAQKGDGTTQLKQHFIDNAPHTPWQFPEDQITDAPTRFFAAELTREKIFMKLQQEIPYSIAVETEKWQEKKNGDITIHQIIYTQKEGQKAIILGKNGSMIKQIGQQSRKELEKILECKINLILFVKVKPNWVERPFD